MQQSSERMREDMASLNQQTEALQTQVGVEWKKKIEKVLNFEP